MVAASLLAACGGGASSSATNTPTRIRTTARPAPGGAVARRRQSLTAAQARRRFLARFICSTATAPARTLRTVRTATVPLGGPPFGVSFSRDGRYAFVGVGNTLDAFAAGGRLPRLAHVIHLPQPAVGSSVTPDGRYLLVADGGDGAMVLSVARIEAGARDAVLGTLSAPTRTRSGPLGGGAIETASTRDGRYAFVSIEYGDAVAVYDLARALAHGFSTSGYVGQIPLGQAVVGLAVSPDGHWLYATSEAAAPGSGLPGLTGTVSVISVARARREPARAVLVNVPARCAPVRVVVSADGRTVWVTARESDDLLAFSAARLRSAPDHALLVAVRVGEAPVGLALASGGTRVVVADSNRFLAPGATSGLTVVSVSAALAHRPAVLGSVPAGNFPREMSLAPDGRTLLVGNYASGSLEVVDTATLP